jgi:hypothetical protein
MAMVCSPLRLCEHASMRPKLRVDRVDDEEKELDYSAIKDLTRATEVSNRPQH